MLHSPRSDKDLMTEVLKMEESLASAYGARVAEAANGMLHEALSGVMLDVYRAHFSLFEAMATRGMYKTLMAVPQDVHIAQQMCRQVLSELAQKQAGLAEPGPMRVAQMPPTVLVGQHLQGYVQGPLPSSP